MPKTTQVDLTGNTIILTREPDANNVPDLIDKANITTVNGVFNKRPDTIEIQIGVVTGSFAIGETVTGATSAATGIIVGFKGIGTLILNTITGTFVAELLTGGTSGATATSTSGGTAVLQAGEWTYPYPTMTVMTINFTDGGSMSIELQEVSNHNTWSDGTLAGLKIAVGAIQAFL